MNLITWTKAPKNSSVCWGRIQAVVTPTIGSQRPCIPPRTGSLIIIRSLATSPSASPETRSYLHKPSKIGAKAAKQSLPHSTNVTLSASSTWLKSLWSRQLTASTRSQLLVAPRPKLISLRTLAWWTLVYTLSALLALTALSKPSSSSRIEFAPKIPSPLAYVRRSLTRSTGFFRPKS